MARRSVRFLRRGRLVELEQLDPTQTLLDHLRLVEAACGTKEGCAEGDCGACTVALGRLVEGRLTYQPVNSCILLTGMLDGCELVTVEDLAHSDDALHPVQQALVDHHGSQCGFCTPGVVMSLFALYHAGIAADRPIVNDWLAGNLCRCTGYRPIAAAALAACRGQAGDGFALAAAETARRLDALADGEDLFVGDESRFFAAPATLDALAELYAEHPDATLVAGATDVGLWIAKQLRDLPKIIHLGRAVDLARIEDDKTGLTIGAAASYAQVEPYIRAIDPDLGELWRRIGGKQVRAVGTVGGNIANGSPIGDTPPALIALGTSLELRHGRAGRTLPLETFFLDYGRQDRAPGELVVRVRVPRLGPRDAFRCTKVAKRFDQDISAVMGAVRLTIDDGRVMAARVAFGGMAAIPKRASAAEAALEGAALGEPATWEPALQALARDFAPIDDMRAGAAYRMSAARAVLRKALIEVSGTDDVATRLAGHRVTGHDRVA